MLNYDYERIRFTQISTSNTLLLAIDQYGEIWCLAGEFRENKELNIPAFVKRPFCTNLMR